jgi:hypothetical protein
MLKRKPVAWTGFMAALMIAVGLGLLHRSYH